jgi:hypothetical protein
MLAYVLAIAIGLISIIFFLAAFFAPKVHRQDDFLWSGVGLFYALVLWVCAERFTGAILLGQTAATLLLLAYGAETINLRGAIANPDKIPAMKSFSVTSWLLSIFGGLFSLFRKPKVKLETTTPKDTIPEKTQETTNVETSNLETEVASQSLESSTSEEDLENQDIEEAIAEELEEVTEELKQTTSVSSPQTKTVKQGNIFSGLLGKINNPFSKNKTQSTGLSAAPILEADEDFEEKTTESLSKETEESIEEISEPSDIIPEVSQEKVESTETIVNETKDLNSEPTITEDLPEKVSPQDPLPVTELDPPKSESNSTEEAIDTPETSGNDLQTRLTTPASKAQSDVNEEKEAPTETSSDFKAEIAKIFEEDNKE